MSIAFAVMLTGTTIFQFAPRLLLSLFDASDHMMDLGVKALRIISLHFPMAAIAITLSSVFQAMGKGVYSLYMSLVRQLVVLLPVAYLLSIVFGLDATWFSFFISEIVSITMAIVLYRRIYHAKIKHLSTVTSV
jgi:Na+-driven multidrug efflux pump